MIDFFDQLSIGINKNDYNKVLIQYFRILAQRGYAIKYDVNHFYIINYNMLNMMIIGEKIHNKILL